MAKPFTFDDGVQLEPGRIVMPFTYAVHRRGDLYPEPDRFLPERSSASDPSPLSGSRSGAARGRCLGASFSLLELEVRVILRMILRHARFRVASTPVEPPGG